MSDEAQRIIVRVVSWAVFILVVVSLIGIVYYWMAIRPSTEQTSATVPVPPERTASAQELQQISASSSAQAPQQEQTQDGRAQELQTLEGKSSANASTSSSADAEQSQAKRAQELQSL
jgi:hypothetical protein